MELFLQRLFCCHILLGAVKAYTLTDEQNLRTSLLTGYDNELTPGTDRTYRLDINTSFYLFSINEFDLNTGKLSLTGFFDSKWFDERLSWNPANFNQTSRTTFPQNRIWLPNFVNINPFEDIKGLGNDLVRVRVSSSGMCEWFALQALEIICDADVSDFPFDTQYCTLKFFIWGYEPTEVKVNFMSTSVILTLYQENGVWDIVSSTTYTQLNFYGFEEIIVGFHLKRRTAYYVTSLILPITSFSLLMGFVFVLPPESGERLGFCTTVLLSIVLYLTLIEGMLPQASEPDVSIIGYILVSYVVSGSIIVVFVIFSFKIQNFSSDEPVPRCIISLIKCCRQKRKVLNSVESYDVKTLPIEDTDYHVTWIEVGKLFDKVCFIISLFQWAVTCIIFFSIVS